MHYYQSQFCQKEFIFLALKCMFRQYKIIINLFYFMNKPSLIPRGKPGAVKKTTGMTLRQRKEHKLEEKQMQARGAVSQQQIADKYLLLTKRAQPNQGKRKACSQEEINDTILSLKAAKQEIDAKGLLALIANIAKRRTYISLDLIRKKIKIESKLLDELLEELQQHSLIRLVDNELYIFKESEVKEQLRCNQQDTQDEIDQNEEVFQVNSLDDVKKCLIQTNRKINVVSDQLKPQHFLSLLTRRPLIRHLELCYLNFGPRQKNHFDKLIQAQEDLKQLENKQSIDCMLYMKLNLQALEPYSYRDSSIDAVFSCAKFYKNLKNLSLNFCTSSVQQSCLERIKQFLIQVPQDFKRLEQFELSCKLQHPFFHETMQFFEENEQKAVREYPLSRVMVTFGQYSKFERQRMESFAKSSSWNSQFTYQLQVVDDSVALENQQKDVEDFNTFIERRKPSITALSIKLPVKSYDHIEVLLKDISHNKGFRRFSLIHGLPVQNENQCYKLVIDYNSKEFFLQIQTDLNSSDHFRELIKWLIDDSEQFRRVFLRIINVHQGDKNWKQILSQLNEFIDHLPQNSLDIFVLDLIGRISLNLSNLPGIFRGIDTKCKTFIIGLPSNTSKLNHPQEEINPNNLRDWIAQLCLLQHVKSIEFWLSDRLWTSIPLEKLQQILALMINANCKFQLKIKEPHIEISSQISQYLNKLSKEHDIIVQRQKQIVMIGAKNQTQRLLSDISSCKLQCEFIETVLGQYQQ